MPELPDVDLYVLRLRERLEGHVLESVLVKSPFVVRSVELRPASLVGSRVKSVERLGKRIVFGFEADRFLVIHLMVAGRFRFFAPGEAAKVAPKLELARFTFASGTLVLTEASTKKRASIHVVQGRGAALDFDAGGIDPMSATLAAFADRLRLENHTLKRSLTDPHLFSGIGNAYSDEILFDAKLSPLRLTSKLTDEEVARLRTSTQKILRSWSEKLAEETPGFPVKVTAFREDFTVYGRYGKPCRVCSRPVMRIAYAENEANYCAQCQNEGRLLADRALSRLMKSDFPRTLEDLEAKKAQARAVFSGSEPAPVTEPKSAKPRRAKKKPTP